MDRAADANGRRPVAHHAHDGVRADPWVVTGPEDGTAAAGPGPSPPAGPLDRPGAEWLPARPGGFAEPSISAGPIGLNGSSRSSGTSGSTNYLDSLTGPARAVSPPSPADQPAHTIALGPISSYPSAYVGNDWADAGNGRAANGWAGPERPAVAPFEVSGPDPARGPSYGMVAPGAPHGPVGTGGPAVGTGGPPANVLGPGVSGPVSRPPRDEATSRRLDLLREQLELTQAEIALYRAAYLRALEEETEAQPWLSRPIDLLDVPRINRALRQELAALERFRWWALELSRRTGWSPEASLADSEETTNRQ